MNSVARLAAAAVVVFACDSAVRAQVVIETVTVGNPGNADDTHGEGYGGVNYVYNIGKFEVTAGQYTEFLNAVADDDTYWLYNASMWTESYGCKIERTNSSPNFSYSVGVDWADRPVNFVSWGDAARFANWMHNGQPTGAQGPGTTEDGSYALDGVTSDTALLLIVREPDATWVIPSEDEWYKAAYHKNDGVTGNYWDYPTETDTAPASEAPPGTDMTNGTANYRGGGSFAIGDPYYRTEFGAYFAKPSDSPYDTFDQGGNVWEWNEAILLDSYRGLRSGSFHDASAVLHAAYRNYSYPTHEGNNDGFRVALMGDCNSNGIPDECDLDCGATIGTSSGLCSDVYPAPACGQSADADADSVPDECGACCHSGGCDQVIEATCDTFGKYGGYGTACEAECPAGIPAVSEWGLVITAALLLVAATIFLRGRPRAALSGR